TAFSTIACERMGLGPTAARPFETMLTNMPHLFFSFRGRANRAGFWLVSLTWGVLGLAFDAVWTATDVAQVPVGRNHLVDVAFALPMLVMLVSCVAIGIRRL